MRSFHLLYVIFFILLGGLIGQYGIKSIPRRWVTLFVPLALTMVLVQQSTFPASEHVEWPGSNNGNTWISAFLSIRSHTPKGAVFAVEPNYMERPGEDAHGFRAFAERSVLADFVKETRCCLVVSAPGSGMGERGRRARYRSLRAGRFPEVGQTVPGDVDCYYAAGTGGDDVSLRIGNWQFAGFERELENSGAVDLAQAAILNEDDHAAGRAALRRFGRRRRRASWRRSCAGCAGWPRDAGGGPGFRRR